MQNASKVGLLVVVFIGLFAAGYALLGRSIFAPKTHTYFADFPDAGGVSEGAAVLLAGVKIGQVSKVVLASPTLAKVTLEINEGIQIPVGTKAMLPGALIGIGDRQIELVAPANATEYMVAGSTMPGGKQSPLETLLPDSKQTITELNKTLVATQDLLGDKGLRSKMNQLMSSGAETAKSFGDLAKRLDMTVAQNQALLRSILVQSSDIVGDVRIASKEMAKLIKSGKIVHQFDSVIASLQQTLQSGNKLLQDMNILVADPELKKNFSAMLENGRLVSESGVKIARDAELMSANGVVITDKAIAITDKVDSLAAKANELAESAKDLLDKLKGAVDKLPIPGKGGGFKLPLVSSTADLYRSTNPERWRTDVGLEVPINSKQTVHLGLWDAFESNKINLQLSQKFGPGQVRYGVFASKPGAGVDFPIASNLGLRADVFGLNDPRFDLKFRYQFKPGISGYIGIDRIFERNSLSIGVGIRK